MSPYFEESGLAANVTALKSIFAPNETIAEFEETIPRNAEIQGVFDALNRDAAEYAQARAAEMVGKRLVNGVLIDNPDAKWRIDEPTREWMRAAVTEAFEEGMSPAELTTRIREDYAFSKSRAKMIAFTETGNINVRTHAEASEKAGATHKRSQLSADHDQDDFCDEAADQGEVAFDFDYGLGLRHPLYHPRCRCSITYYFRRKAVAA